MKVLTLIFIVFISTFATAQSVQDKEFIAWYLKQTKMPLIFSDEIHHLLPRETKFLLNDTVAALRNNTISNKYLVLTPGERYYIQNEFQAPDSENWAAMLPQDTKIIRKDTLNDIFNSNQFFGGWVRFHKDYGPGYFTISKPVFIRNNSICFFYIDYGCDYLCAAGSLGVYIKINDEWHLWQNITRWDS